MLGRSNIVQGSVHPDSEAESSDTEIQITHFGRKARNEYIEVEEEDDDGRVRRPKIRIRIRNADEETEPKGRHQKMRPWTEDQQAAYAAPRQYADHSYGKDATLQRAQEADFVRPRSVYDDDIGGKEVQRGRSRQPRSHADSRGDRRRGPRSQAYFNTEEQNAAAAATDRIYHEVEVGDTYTQFRRDASPSPVRSEYRRPQERSLSMENNIARGLPRDDGYRAAAIETDDHDEKVVVKERWYYRPRGDNEPEVAASSRRVVATETVLERSQRDKEIDQEPDRSWEDAPRQGRTRHRRHRSPREDSLDQDRGTKEQVEVKMEQRRSGMTRSARAYDAQDMGPETLHRRGASCGSCSVQ